MTNPYVQTQCARCGKPAWALPTQAVPCQSCGQAVGPVGTYGASAAAPQIGASAPYSGAPAAPAAMPYGTNPSANPWGAYAGAAPAPMPAATAAPAAAAPAPAAQQFSVNVGGIKIPFKVGGGAGGVSRLKIFGAIGLAIVLAIGGVFVKMKFGTTAKGNLSYAGLGVDNKKPDGDKLIAALAKPAGKWKKDAIWWSANFQAVDAEGRVDVSKGAEVVYISESRVQSAAKSVRKDSVKKYSAGSAGVSHSKIWGASEPWQGIERHPTADCSIKDVMALVAKELPAGKTVRVTFDPKFADFYAWRVLSDAPKIDRLYAFSDCSIIK